MMYFGQWDRLGRPDVPNLQLFTGRGYFLTEVVD
jgi:hypothetical protein